MLTMLFWGGAGSEDIIDVITGLKTTNMSSMKCWNDWATFCWSNGGIQKAQME